MGNGIGFADIGEKLVAQTFAFGCAGYQTGNINKFHAGGYLFFWLDYSGNSILPRIGNRYDTGIGFNGAEGEVFCSDTGFG